MPRSIRTCLLPLALFLPVLAAAQTPPPAPASTDGPQGEEVRIKLKRDPRIWDILLTGRTADGRISYRRPTSHQQTVFLEEVAGLEMIEFKVPFDGDAVKKRYDDGDYVKLIADISEPLRPYLVYQDLKNNLLPYVMLLARCHHYGEKFSEGMPHYDRLLRTLPRGSEEHREITLLRTIALHNMGRGSEVPRILAGFRVPAVNDAIAPAYWYSLARTHLSTNNLVAARDATTRIVAFAPKDFNWFTPALLETAREYGKADAFDVSRQIRAEMRTINPGNEPILAAVKSLEEEMDRREEAYKAEKARIAREEAAKAARSPLRSMQPVKIEGETLTEIKPEEPAAGTQPGRPDLQ